MTVRSFFIFYVAAALIVASCGKQEAPQKPAAPAPTKTGAVAGSPADLGRANIHEVINTRGVEQATRSHLGNTRGGPDQAVTTDVTTFKPKDPIYLTMWLPMSPKGLQVSAQWLDGNGKVLRDDRMNLSGEKVVTFSWMGKPLAPGKYHVTGYWGGNVAAEHDFTVEGTAAAKKK
jgi:hypothetical protein